METNPRTWIAALRSSQVNLASLVGSLTPEQLRQPSYHSWTNAKVLSHLGSQAEIFMDWVTAAVEGTDPPPPEAMQVVWDAWDKRTPDDQASDSVAVNETLVRRFENLSDSELNGMHLSLFGMELDSTGLPQLRLAEHALHTWDIAVSLDPDAQVIPEATTLLVDALGLIATYTGKPQGTRFRLHVRTSDPSRELLLDVADSVDLIPWDGGAEDGELLIPAEGFVRLVYGRLDADHSTAIEVTGPASLEQLRLVFPGA